MDQLQRRREMVEIIDSMAGAIQGIGAEAVAMMTDGRDIIDGISIGERAGLISEHMAKANTARRARDIDGYRRALRRAAVLCLGAIVEIGEDPAACTDTIEGMIRAEAARRRASRIGIRDTEAGRAYLDEIERERRALRTVTAPSTLIERGRVISGDPETGRLYFTDAEGDQRVAIDLAFPRTAGPEGNM